MGKMLSVKQAAEMLDVCPHTVYRMAGRGQLPHMRLGRMLRIPADALHQFIQEQTATPKR
jgi:excisionase family DNA binding protein